MPNGTTPPDIHSSPEIKKRAIDTYHGVKDFLCTDLHLPEILADAIAGAAAAVVFTGSWLFAIAIWAYVHTFGFAFDAIFQTTAEARKALGPIVGTLSVGVLNELFGGILTTDDISTQVGLVGERKRAFQVGQKFRDALIGEFVPDGTVTPRTGYDAAASFAGYAVNFAVATAFLDILFDAASFGHFEEFKEIGVGATRNLGLGRMQARSWRAIIDEVINLPATRFVKNKYRTTLPSEPQIVLLADGLLVTDSDARLWLGYLGWPDRMHDALFEFHRKRLDHGQLFRLLRYKLVTLQDAVTYLQHQGFTEDTARLLLADLDLQRADVWQEETLRFAMQSYVDGAIDVEAWTSIVSAANVGEGEKRLLAATADFRRNTPHRFLTPANAQKALLENVIDLDAFAKELRDHGYSDDDNLTLQFIALIASGRAAEAQKVAEYKWEQAVAKAKAKNLPPPPKPPILV
jgi:hypothetical protein